MIGIPTAAFVVGFLISYLIFADKKAHYERFKAWHQGPQYAPVPPAEGTSNILTNQLFSQDRRMIMVPIARSPA